MSQLTNEFQSFIDRNTKLVNCTLEFRISDNVLEKKHWSVVQIELNQHGRVCSLKYINEGIYEVHQVRLGDTLDGVINCSHLDDTGSYPEIYHELRLVD